MTHFGQGYPIFTTKNQRKNKPCRLAVNPKSKERFCSWHETKAKSNPSAKLVANLDWNRGGEMQKN